MQEQQDRLPSIFVVPLIQFFVGLLLFVALLQGQRGLTILALLVLCLVSAARLWSRVSLSGIKYYSGVDKRKLFPGEKFTFDIQAENAKPLPIWLQIEVPVDSALRPSTSKTALTQESGLLWYQRASFHWELAAQRRGCHRIGPPQVRVGDLLGFFPREKGSTESLDIIVYPRLVPLKSLFLPRRDFFGIPGARSPVHDPIYILGTRDYQHWRPARYIHWKASARHNRLQEKVCEPAEQEKVLLVVEVNQFASNKAAESFEQALEIVASLAVQLNHRGYAVGLASNGFVVGGGPAIQPIARSPQQLSAILEVLARLQMKPAGDLVDILHKCLDLPWGVSCAHFSYEKDEITRTTERYFMHRKVPVVFIVGQPAAAIGQGEHGIRGDTYSLDDIGVNRVESL